MAFLVLGVALDTQDIGNQAVHSYLDPWLQDVAHTVCIKCSLPFIHQVSR